MIFLRILSSNEEKIEQIAYLLLERELVLDINIKKNIERIRLNKGKLQFEPVYLITSKTRGLLFPAIDRLLREEFGDEMPEIYSLPIVHMDFEQALQLKEDIRQV
jgi:uncharacterized protein involved in tolerance to divalent cations